MADEEFEQVKINDYPVFYTERSKAGVTFLKEVLSRSEAEVFFFYAKAKGKCPLQAMFRDGYGKNLTLEFNPSKYAFYLYHREYDY